MRDVDLKNIFETVAHEVHVSMDGRNRNTYLAPNKSTIFVGWPGYEVSDQPLHSSHYFSCNGVVLMAGYFAALSHYASEERTPSDYIEMMIKDLSGVTDSGDGLTAVLVGGYSEHFHRNKQILSDRSIPIVGEYLEDIPGEDSSVRPNKAILVIPSSKLVILRAEPEKYKLLSFEE